MAEKLAPIVVFVYNRADKTKRMIESLAANCLASESEVYIYADGQKTEYDVRVSAVREYVDTIDGLGYFKRVTVKKAEKNKGLSASIIGGVTEVINKYGKVIVLEDDLILSEWFLKYMNECLDYYENDDRIYSISGYAPYLRELDTYDKDVFLICRTHSWGWGTWKNRWELVDWKVSDYKSFFFNPVKRKKFARGGNDLLVMLNTEMRGLSSSWAVRFCYSQYKNNMMTVAPKISLVGNDGLDNTGTHCKSTDLKKYGNMQFADRIGDWCVSDLTLDRKIGHCYYKNVKIKNFEVIKADLRYIVHLLKDITN